MNREEILHLIDWIKDGVEELRDANPYFNPDNDLSILSFGLQELGVDSLQSLQKRARALCKDAFVMVESSCDSVRGDCDSEPFIMLYLYQFSIPQAIEQLRAFKSVNADIILGLE